LTGVPDGRWVLLSPHLDDAVLSCGNLLLALAGRADPLVATVFTEHADPTTWSARPYLRQCGAVSAEALYAERRAEDARVVEEAGAQWLHAGLPEALFRQREPWRGTAVLRRLLPELVHVYPTYRLHVASGRVSRYDRRTVGVVESLVADLLASGPAVLVAPLGVGSHVDHVLVRDVAAATDAPVVYYADLPYALHHPADRTFTARHDLIRATIHPQDTDKRSLIEGYRTQATALFPAGVPELADEFYIPSRDLAVEG